MDRLFVYGIFLGERMRNSYDMTEPRYATVKDYATVGVTQNGHIVQAIKVDGAVLTGLIVNIPSSQWERLDALEGGYDRIRIVTTDNEHAYMYAEREYENERTTDTASSRTA